MLLRATVADQPLILLEEPFSDMDDESKQLVVNFLLHTLKNSTVLVVCNDEDFIKKCHREFRLQNQSMTIQSHIPF